MQKFPVMVSVENYKADKMPHKWKKGVELGESCFGELGVLWLESFCIFCIDFYQIENLNPRKCGPKFWFQSSITQMISAKGKKEDTIAEVIL